MKTELSTTQLLAVTSEARNLLICAGPGSGKTRCLTERIRHIIRRGTDPAEIIAITYTVAAAAEITQRLHPVRLRYCGTLHGFLLRLLEADAGQRLTVLDEEQSATLIADVAKEQGYVGTKADLQAEINLGPKVALPGASRTHAQIVASRFYRRLLAANMVTFDAILHLGKQLIHRTGYSLPWPVQHLLVDECQDSSDTDWSIYCGLPIPNKTWVGDQDQSIFGWRGADPAGIVRLSENKEVTTVMLEDNYRCGSAICAAAQQLIQHNKDRVPKVMRSATGTEGFATIHQHSDDSAEKVWLAEAVRRSSGSVAVLVRTNHLVRQFSDALVGAGIKVARKEQREMPVDWARAKTLLTLLANPDNDQAAEWYIGQTSPAQAKTARLKAAAAGRSVNEAVLRIPTGLAGNGILDFMAKDRIFPESIEIVRRVVERLGETASASDITIALRDTTATEAEPQDGVCVSTLHSAKGREFDTVFMPAFEHGVIPGKRSSVAEERRLAFVGFTRARSELRISYALARMPEWGTQRLIQANASDFIREAIV